ncbi:hypothetical protein PQX77_021313 [Marasmius sp. AFHP31]|nr:hypothetical protein PQX77_021313 [Marasmius sp. AFHP31]
MSTSVSNDSTPANAVPLEPESPNSAVLVALTGTPENPPHSPVDVAQPQANLPASTTQAEDTGSDLKLLTSHRVHSARATWGNGDGSWGNGDGTDDPWMTVLQAPKIVSLTPGRVSWTDPGDRDAIFQWRAVGASGKPSHRHIVLYVRSDLHAIFNPVKQKTSPSGNDNTGVWARTQVIRCLPEAQHANIPGPDFTIDELAVRTDAVDSKVSSIRETIEHNVANIEAIRSKQEPLRAALRALDNERVELSKRNERLEAELLECREVQADLKDLAALAMAFSPV